MKQSRVERARQSSAGRRGAGNTEHTKVRVEDVNYGARGWTVRLGMLKTGVEDGKAYQECYGRQDR